MKDLNIVLKNMSDEEFEQRMEESEEDSVISQLATALATSVDEKELNTVLQAISEILEKNERSKRVFGLYNGDTYVGHIVLADYESSTPEIQIELVEEYRHRGIGYRALQSVIDLVFQRKDVAFLIYRAGIDDIPSIALAQKCGGVLEKYDPLLDRIIHRYHIYRPNK
jgi:RimJ/RimL family protein N-acetyltransferase